MLVTSIFIFFHGFQKASFIGSLKVEIVLERVAGGKHGEERRKCCLPAIFLFP